MNTNWELILKDRLALFGHRNWLVIADSAYPAQSRSGIETITADEEQTTVLEKAHEILSVCEHITARVYTDKELSFVRENDAPGISAYRDKLRSILNGYELSAIPHETIIWKLDQVAEKFRVLLIKSKMRIPYTSVFFDLECGYWKPDAEKRLRSAMRPKRHQHRASGAKSNP